MAEAAALPLVAITAYDYPVARLLDEAGVDLILVGDSLGMVVLVGEAHAQVTKPHLIGKSKDIKNYNDLICEASLGYVSGVGLRNGLRIFFVTFY